MAVARADVCWANAQRLHRERALVTRDPLHSNIRKHVLTCFSNGNLVQTLASSKDFFTKGVFSSQLKLLTSMAVVLCNISYTTYLTADLK